MVDAAAGGVLDEITLEATAEGYAELVEFANNHPMLRAWAIEGTGGHGTGLSRHLLESRRSSSSWIARSEALLFLGSKPAHLGLVIQGRPDRAARASDTTAASDLEFGPCSTFGECAHVCPAGIPLAVIAMVPKESLRARLRGPNG